MATWCRWAAGAASVGVIAGLGATSGVMALAQHFVAQLSRPHVSIEDAASELTGWQVPQNVPEPAADRRRSLHFDVPSGPRLCGEFWAQPHPAPTVVICHGYRVHRALLRPVAALEYAHGYNTLLFDFRGHGESAAVATSGGNAEVRDLAAALDVAAQQPETLPNQLFIHGFSMGGAVALLLPPRFDVAGIIADSPYARLDEILRQLITWQLTEHSTKWIRPLRSLRLGFPALARAIFVASDLIFRVRFRHPLRARPDVRLRSLRLRLSNRVPTPGKRTPILLIHSVRDPLIPMDHTLRLALAARSSGMPVHAYFADSDTHCGAYGYDPDRYIAELQRLVSQGLASSKL
ncbi:MAG: alpha/beta hydrolase [Ktedonobacterales bacterium]